MTALHHIRARLDQASGLIDGFRRRIVDGELVDLTGLDHDIGALCEAIAKLPPDERLVVKGSLIALTDDMNALVESLKEQHQETSEELKGVASRQKAVSAYGKGQAGKRRGKDPAE